ncbi:MAG: WD40/YVTN/BNR-like repeat-containing protein [Kofleriaceae bacterium]
MAQSPHFTFTGLTRSARGLVLVGNSVVASSDDDGTTWRYLRTDDKTPYFRGVASLGTALVAPLITSVIRSTNAGKTWRIAPLTGKWARWYEIAVAKDGRSALAATSRGVARATGAQWTIVQDGDLRAIWAGDAVVIAVGHDGVVLRSTDGGKTFVAAKAKLRNLEAISGSGSDVYALATGGGGVVHSSDNGITWHARTALGRKALPSIVALGNGVVLAIAGYGKVARSTDHGQRWVTTEVNVAHRLVVIGERVWAIGTGIAWSDDTGQTWTTVSLPMIAEGLDDQPAVEHTRPPPGSKTTAGWQKIATNTKHSLESIFAIDNTIIIGGSGVYLRSVNDGPLRLKETPVPEGKSYPMGFEAIHGASAAELYAVCGRHAIARSTDLGATWTCVKSVVRNGPILRAVYSPATGEALAIADTKHFRLSPNSKRWSESASCAASAIWAAADGTVYGVHRNEIARSTDRGVTWKVMKIKWADRMHAICGNADGIWIACGDGTVLFSATGGRWTKQPTGATGLRAITCVGKRELYAVGLLGTVVHTTNGGTTWKVIDVGSKESLTAVWGDGNHVLIAGDKGLVIQRC